MSELNSFVCNIVNPNLPDADSRLVSPEVQEPKRTLLLQYMRDYIAQHRIGIPAATVDHTSEQLQAMGLVGLYKADDIDPVVEVKHKDFVVVKPQNDDPTAKPTGPMNKFVRRKQIYRHKSVLPEKGEINTIDSYTPSGPGTES